MNEQAAAVESIDDERPIGRRWERMSVAVALGIALGLFSLVGASLPNDAPTILLNGLANAAGPWTLVAFASGIVQRRPRAGALAGAIALVVAVVAYYAAFILVWGDRLADVRITAVVWLLAAIVAGAVMGAAGGLLASPDRRLRALALAIVGGALIAEAVYLLVQLEVWRGIDPSRTYLVVAIFDLIAAAILPLLLGDRGYRALAYVGSALLAVAGYVALNVVIELARAGITMLAWADHAADRQLYARWIAEIIARA